MIRSQDQLVHFSYVPSVVSAGGMKLPADLTSKSSHYHNVSVSKGFWELYNKLINAMPAAEV